MQKSLGVFFRGKLDYDEPLRLPIAFYNVYLAPSNHVLTLVLFNKFWAKACVLVVSFGIVDGYIGNNIRAHSESSSILVVA